MKCGTGQNTKARTRAPQYWSRKGTGKGVPRAPTRTRKGTGRSELAAAKEKTKDNADGTTAAGDADKGHFEPTCVQAELTGGVFAEPSE